jgi:hypothetical protein
MRTQLPMTIAVVLVAPLSSAAAAASAAPRVSMEIAAETGLPIDAAQRWSQALASLGIDGVRIRAASPRDTPAVSKQGAGFQVVGVLASDNVLYLPGGKFKMNDSGAMKQWLAKLRDGGAVGVTQSRSAFGLLPSQLEQVTNDLKRPVTTVSTGSATSDAVRQIAGTLGSPLVIDARTSAALESSIVADDVNGLSAGTALAILLRPAGLALVPERVEGELRYHVHRAARGQQSWPIGWKPEKRISEVLPRLFEFLNVEITAIPVSQAVEAIQVRLEVPVFYDRNAMALFGIDPAQTPAELPSKRISYSQTLNRLLSQAKLKYELRVDEAEKPFLWITSIKPAE